MEYCQKRSRFSRPAKGLRLETWAWEIYQIQAILKDDSTSLCSNCISSSQIIIVILASFSALMWFMMLIGYEALI